MIGSRQLVQLVTCLTGTRLNFCQSMMASLLVLPPSVRGQKNVDREAFKVTLDKAPCVLLPTQSFNKFRAKLKNFLLKLPNFKPVQTPDNFEGKSIVYLDPGKVKNISDELKEELEWDKAYEEKSLQLSYENWSSDEILRAILPENIEVPTSYSTIGHIVHVNLRDEQLPFKNIISQVFLDKIHHAKTVVNKVDSIDNTFRNFAMEVLAGENNTIVSVKEYGFTYEFDFAKVYWNPRLSTEHSALVNFLKPGDVLYDIFAGVGPFSIPAARKGVRVLANDLNPESYKWLVKNAQTNKVAKLLTAFNKDGRDFLKNDVKTDILDRRKTNKSGREHMAMNLPALAIEFLDVFANWLNTEDLDKVLTKPPTIHVYCFIKAGKTEDFHALAKELVEEKLGAKLDSESLIKIHHVRNVAPNKEMMRVSFFLPKEILKNEEPARKKLKLANSNVAPDVLGYNGKEQDKREEPI